MRPTPPPTRHPPQGTYSYYSPTVDNKSEHLRLVREARAVLEDEVYDIVERVRK